MKLEKELIWIPHYFFFLTSFKPALIVPQVIKLTGVVIVVGWACGVPGVLSKVEEIYTWLVHRQHDCTLILFLILQWARVGSVPLLQAIAFWLSWCYTCAAGIMKNVFFFIAGFQLRKAVTKEQNCLSQCHLWDWPTKFARSMLTCLLDHCLLSCCCASFFLEAKLMPFVASCLLVGWFVRLLNGIFCWLCSFFVCLFVSSATSGTFPEHALSAG